MISVNENKLEWKNGLSVRDALNACKYSFPLVIVRVNGEHVSKADYDNYLIPDNAEVSVIHLMSGG